MNLKRLRCLLFIIAFSMPALAAMPYQIDSFDDINNIIVGPNWVETPEGVSNGTYMEQEEDVNMEGTGSMKFDFPSYVWPFKNDDVTRTFSPNTVTFDPNLDFSNYKDLAITLWVWTGDPDDSRYLTRDSRLMEISLHDGSAFSADPNRVGHFTVLPLKNVGWNKVIAPLRNFAWKETGTPIDPNVADWNDITKIGLWARTEHDGSPTFADNNAIYIDDMQLEWAPPQPSRPYQVASCDDINDELWLELRNSGAMLQSDSNFMEGTGSMMVDFTLFGGAKPDITPAFTFIPALDFTGGNDWAITMWVWTDLVNDSELHEMILHDAADNLGRYRVPLRATYGWNKVTARIDEFLWEPGATAEGIPRMTADEACLDTILFIEMWTSSYIVAGNEIYLDNLRIEPAVEALSEAVVYNADYTPVPLAIDGNAIDWADLVDSDIIDIDLKVLPNAPDWGDLHVKYRLAWDPNYLYILVEEQDEPGTGDLLATEAATFANFTTDGLSTAFDSLALWFDFTNNRLAGLKTHVSFWLFLGMSSTGQNDLMMAWTNATWYYQSTATDPVANGSVATSGTLGSRVIEARVKWSDLDNAIDSWFQPAGGIAAAVQPGYIFGCDPRLQDRENLTGYDFDATHGAAWFTGWVWDDVPLHPGDFMPTGRDTFSTDIRLVYSAGDLDFDGDVNFVDYAQFAAEWDVTDCNNLNDFCNGADIVTPMDGDVDLYDLGRFALRWLLP